MIDTVDELWNEVSTAELSPSVYFGKVNFDLWPCVLVKGQGAVVFDPNQHKPEDRRIQIEISITPLSSARKQFITERKALAESRDWIKVTLASIKALGLQSAREVDNRWVQYVMEPTGRKYTDKNGIERDNTMPKILAVYDSEEAAEAAKVKLYGKTKSDEDLVFEPDPPKSNGNGEREVAMKFLPSIVAMCNKDRKKIAQMLASQPLVSKYFTVDSPEVQMLLA